MLKKPRILLLADVPNWVFYRRCLVLKKLLGKEFSFDIKFVLQKPEIDQKDYQLIYVFFWGETYHQKFKIPKNKLIKMVWSHRWQDDPRYGPLAPKEFCKKYLSDAGTVVCPSKKLFDLLNPCRERVFLLPSGYEPKKFYNKRRENKNICIGWAGNINDSVKRVNEILIPACKDKFDLKIAGGKMNFRNMRDFYNSLDVYALTSRHEGDPQPLIESMASGCFPVCTNVGIVPELIKNMNNGIIIKNPTPKNFQKAFERCEKNVDLIKLKGIENAKLMLFLRSWDKLIGIHQEFFNNCLEFTQQYSFRNDDVFGETNLKYFKIFCQIFNKYGFKQLHAVTPISEINIEKNIKLVDFLNYSGDEIALHGLRHIDYALLNPRNQENDIKNGLKILKNLFPSKKVKYFVPPYNSYDLSLEKVCKKYNLIILAKDGLHLEEEINKSNWILPSENVWFRYHHHRFYPGSDFNYYKLSFALLDKYLYGLRYQ